MTPNLKSPSEIPALIEQLKSARFYGNIHITFRAGHIARVVTEQSQVFDDPQPNTQGRTYNDYSNR